MFRNVVADCILSSTIQYGSTRSNMMSKGEMFGHKTMIERV